MIPNQLFTQNIHYNMENIDPHVNYKKYFYYTNKAYLHLFIITDQQKNVLSTINGWIPCWDIYSGQDSPLHKRE